MEDSTLALPADCLFQSGYWANFRSTIGTGQRMYSPSLSAKKSRGLCFSSSYVTIPATPTLLLNKG